MPDDTTPDATPEPEVIPPAAPATTVAAPAPAPASAQSPWFVLLPVLVGVGALLIGLFAGGAMGFALGSHLHRGPGIEIHMPDGPRDGDRHGPFLIPGD